MINTTKDVLYLVISFCILWFTIFVCWGIYYVVMILREGRKIVQDVRKKIELVERVLGALKDKLESTSSHVKLLMETALNVAEYIKDRKKDNKKKK